MHLLTHLDVLRLERHVRDLGAEVERERIDGLLATAHVIPGEEVPDDVVTMNSNVVYRDLATQVAHEITLVYPELADNAQHRLSVTSAVGVALLGARLGETVSVLLPNGLRRQLQILAVPFQPEAAGQYHL
jgi:regulator of nucleoside diphosphate kinase